MDSQRALLDQLMGKHRNLGADEKSKMPRWDDDRVCQWYNLSFCPHDLFTNTRSDLGVCAKEHDPQLKADFAAEVQKNPRLQADLERRFITHLNSILSGVDKRITQHNARLSADAELDDPDVRENEAKVKDFGEQIKTLMAQMEELGTEGKVDESQALLKLVESLKINKAALEKQISDKRAAAAASLQSKSQIVCEVCGAILVKNDAEQRVESHLNGKQHMGFKTIRDTIAKLKEKHGVTGSDSYYERPPRSNRSPSPRRRSPPRRRSRSPRRRSRSPPRGSRGYDRDRGYRYDRDRDRDRDRSRSRSRSRSSGRRDRDRRR